jgi:hypothetical protein
MEWVVLEKLRFPLSYCRLKDLTTVVGCPSVPRIPPVPLKEERNGIDVLCTKYNTPGHDELALASGALELFPNCGFGWLVRISANGKVEDSLGDVSELNSSSDAKSSRKHFSSW